MIFTSRFIISTGGVYFVFKRAEPNFFPVMRNLGLPTVLFFTKMDADIYRGGIFPFFAVAHILGFSRQAEICPSVIEAIAISVVNQKIIGGIQNIPVHTCNYCFTVNFNGPSSIELIQAAGKEPFEIVKTIVILLVKNCPFTLAEINPSKRITILVSAISHHRPGADFV